MPNPLNKINLGYNKTSRTLFKIVGAYTFLLLMDYSNNHQHNYTLCIFKNLTGIPCPGCGIGRGTLALLKGNIEDAFYFNILCIPLSLAILCSTIWLIYDLIRGKETFFKTINLPIKPIYLVPFFVLMIISWITNILRNI